MPVGTERHTYDTTSVSRQRKRMVSTCARAALALLVLTLCLSAMSCAAVGWMYARWRLRSDVVRRPWAPQNAKNARCVFSGALWPTRPACSCSQRQSPCPVTRPHLLPSPEVVKPKRATTPRFASSRRCLYRTSPSSPCRRGGDAQVPALRGARQRDVPAGGAQELAAAHGAGSFPREVSRGAAARRARHARPHAAGRGHGVRGGLVAMRGQHVLPRLRPRPALLPGTLALVPRTLAWQQVLCVLQPESKDADGLQRHSETCLDLITGSQGFCECG